MHHILVVEDEPQIAQVLQRGLTYKGFVVTVATSGKLAIENIQHFPQDLVVLDVMLPDMDGFEVCHRLRSMEYKSLPILMLTARDGVKDKIAGLDSGADDYITKPFSQRLLLERIRALLRRNEAGKAEGSGTAPSGVMTRGDLVLDETKHQCTWRGHDIQLTVTEFLLVKALAARPGMVKSRDQLIDAAMARSLHADACRKHTAVAWAVLWDLPAYPERYAARMATSDQAPSPYLMLADSLAAIRAMLPPSMTRSERMPADPPEVVEIWLAG